MNRQVVMEGGRINGIYNDNDKYNDNENNNDNKTKSVEDLSATIDPCEVDQILSRELQNLDVQDRESINEEVHGVRCLAPTETIEMLNASLMKLSQELDLISDKPAYERSQQLGLANVAFGGGTYVNTVDFRLKFLRCELFDAKKAAARLVTFLDLIWYLFGKEEVLLRPLKITDLDKKEMAILKIGNFQLLPYRDRSGRRVFTLVLDLSLHHDFQITVCKVLFCAVLYCVLLNSFYSTMEKKYAEGMNPSSKIPEDDMLPMTLDLITPLFLSFPFLSPVTCDIYILFSIYR